jgi:hypothetical protein
MRLKPGLFQLVVVLMTSSLIVSCNTSPKGTQVDCNDPVAKQSEDCNSSSGGSTSRSVYRGSRNSNNSTKPSSAEDGSGTRGVIVPGNPTGDSGSGSGNSSGQEPSQVGGKSSGESNATSKAGRGGFGSFGRGSSGG